MDPTPTPEPLPLNEERMHAVDPTTVTGAYAAVRGKYGRRKGDKPLWWVFLYHFLKALGALLPYVVAAAMFKACGMEFSGSGK